jgi:putative membrane protein
MATTAIFMVPHSALAATAGASPVASALAAYGHYLGLFGMVASLVAERLILERAPYNSTPEDEDQLFMADALYGIFALLVVGTGYSRAGGNLGKGFDFYAHEPLFWLKIAMVGVLASTSFFNTTKIIQRAVAKRNAASEGEGAPCAVDPMSDALVARMKQICNAQLSGLAFIPLAATLTARGVGYNDSIPWQAEAGLALVATIALSYKYVKEAVAFEENDKIASEAAVTAKDSQWRRT